MRKPRLLLAILCLFTAGQSPVMGAPAEQLLASTFRILDKDSSGTCFLVHVGPDNGSKAGFTALVTAGHVLDGMKGTECRLVLRARQGDGTYIRRETKIQIRRDGKPRWKRHADVDVAAMTVALPEDVAASSLEFEQLADERAFESRLVRVGQEVWLAGFPAQLESNPAGWPVLRRGTIASYPLTPIAATKTFLADVSSFGGDSGAPVLILLSPLDGRTSAARPLIAGLVIGMQRQTDKTSLPFEELTFHMPLGLAIVAEAPFIRETVELLIQECKEDHRAPTTAPAASASLTRSEHQLSAAGCSQG